MDEKRKLRESLRARRRAYFGGLPESTRALLFMRPPGPVAARIGDNALVGLYHAIPPEAPTHAYARWLVENGRRVAFPWFAGRGAQMEFRLWDGRFDEEGMEVGPYGALQPPAEAPPVTPEIVFVPLLGFTADGHRLGQGGGHYDRWLARNPAATAYGLAWDCQLADALPLEPHDRRLDAVITPTTLYERLA